MKHLHQHSISSSVGTTVERGKRGAYDACDLVGVGVGGWGRETCKQLWTRAKRRALFEDGLHSRGFDLVKAVREGFLEEGRLQLRPEG